MTARRLALCGIVLLAFALRLVGLRYGLPAVYNPDEVAIVSRALAFAKGDLNPHNFLYPTFYFYVLFAWEGLTAVVAVLTRQVASLGAFEKEFFVDPTRVYVAARLLTALCGTATVVATWALARRLFGDVAGRAAALFVAVAPLHVRDSHYVKHDVPVTLLVVLAYLAYQRLWARTLGRSRGFRLQAEGPLIAAAAITGVAFSTHYYAIFLAIPLAWSAMRGASDPRAAVERVAIAALVSAAVFFALSPFLLAEPAAALRDIHANRQIVVDRAVEGAGYLATLARYTAILWHDTTGWPLVILGLIGLVLSRRRVARTIWLLAFPVPFFLFIASTVPASRYLVPLVPFIALFGGAAIATLDARSRPAGALTVMACILLPISESVRTDLFIRQADTRTLAARFIERRIPAGTTIATQPYSVVLAPTREVLAEAVLRNRRAMPAKTRLEMERTPYPSPAYRVLWLGKGLDADKIYLPYDQLDGAAPLLRLRQEHVAFVVWKRYNEPDPATVPFLSALARDGRRIAVFSPYRDGLDASGGKQPEPFLHNTDTRITSSLVRPGPVVEIWQLDVHGS